jgi:NAD(P)-dependent dehydrogenase (short-subunit alcohol dehydrogenase family)
MVMDSFAGKLAVVTGGGSGMGRELTRRCRQGDLNHVASPAWSE